MSTVVLILGLAICAVCLFMLVKPLGMIGFANKVFYTRWIYAAGLARFMLGALLIAVAPSVAYSGVVEFFGWLFALGGLLLVVVPVAVWRRLVGWATGLGPNVIRCVAVLAFLFGAFFVYAALV
jgi:hypothetical protein